MISSAAVLLALEEQRGGVMCWCRIWLGCVFLCGSLAMLQFLCVPSYCWLLPAGGHQQLGPRVPQEHPPAAQRLRLRRVHPAVR